MNNESEIPYFGKRRILLLILLLLSVCLLLWRAVYLQVFNKDFLQSQGDARHLRVVSIPAHRGMITDRNGEPLAISTPVDSVWANPQELTGQRKYLTSLSRILSMDPDRINRKLASRPNSEFVYIKRHINPDQAQKVRELDAPGVFLQREYRRYYPAGEVAAHVVGFTNIDDAGQEGLELAYDDWLKGVKGSKRIIKDRLGHIVENVESIRPMNPGGDLVLSIDRRIQYLAYRELKAAVKQHKARSGSVVMLDVKTGEVLAMVNQPSFNPNSRNRKRGSNYRNRAITDVFEPGSAIKPFTIATALESGKYLPTTPIDTSPGFLKVGHNTVRDLKNYGQIDVSHVITKSSNVGASKIALSLEPEQLWNMYRKLGFGQVSNSGFPGESAGLVTHFRRWHPIEQATLSFGYGLSITPLQLAHAYTVLAADGVRKPTSFVRIDTIPEGEPVISPTSARQVIKMLETVVSSEGTGLRASVHGYRVAGKTGTVHKSTAGGYAQDRYVSVFAGMAPASRPRLVMVVMVNEPSGEEYFGGQVAAPVFSRVMNGALRLMDIAPDNLPMLVKVGGHS